MHLSDLHIKFSTRRMVALRRMIELSGPDLVVMTGDHVGLPAGARRFRDFLKVRVNRESMARRRTS